MSGYWPNEQAHCLATVLRYCPLKYAFQLIESLVEMLPNRRFSAAAATACLFLVMINPAQAQQDFLAECERFGVAFTKKHGASTSNIKIERGNALSVNRFDDSVGSQFVSSEFSGFAVITDGEGARRQRFVCLHEGAGKRPVYFGLFDE